jgi:DNA repair ATPase RecN
MPTALSRSSFASPVWPAVKRAPLAKVASGGEISRISLAIQVVTSQAASVPTLIFDEVDVGIGGGVAEVVGRCCASWEAERQVLCVTHLPQVAARANWQWQVSKKSELEQVRSRVALSMERRGSRKSPACSAASRSRRSLASMRGKCWPRLTGWAAGLAA